MFHYVHSSLIYNSQNLKRTQISLFLRDVENDGDNLCDIQGHFTWGKYC